MGTTADKLNHLINTKEGIRQEINRAYGMEKISISDTFNSYIQKLEEHPFYINGLIEGTIKDIKVSEVSTIGEYAFYRCDLTSASFPNVTRIEAYAFRECHNLISASFPKVSYIAGDGKPINKKGAFYICDNLTTIYVGTETSTVCTIGSYSFYECKKLTNIYVPASLVNSYKSATNWSDYADKIKAAP